MKLRIKGNSIRLRLTQAEVKEFQGNGVVEEIVKFGNTDSSKMHYLLQVSSGNEINALYESNKMIVNIPNPIADKWTTTNQVGFETQMKINEEEDLFILVEKDFKCLQPREHEDENDMFPNPAEGTLKC